MTFEERVNGFKADAPARAARRANRSAGQKIADAVIGYGGLLLILAALAAVIALLAVGVWVAVVSGAWVWIVGGLVGLVVLAVVAAGSR